MRIYVVYDYWKEVGNQVVQDRMGAELDVHDLENRNGIEIFPSVVSLGQQLAKVNNFSRVVILNVISLPILGMGTEQKIITPSLVVPRGPA